MVFKCSPKYFQRLKEAQAETPVTATVPPFDLQRMRSTGFLARVAGYFIEHPDWWLAVLRAVLPRARCGRFVLLTRNADVREVLERQADFETPYGPEMMEFAGGKALSTTDFRRRYSSPSLMPRMKFAPPANSIISGP
jgi:hypothetical protein